MTGFCRAVFYLVVLLYAVALFLFLSGTFGWFGVEQDPLAGVFLIPLGLPWNLLVDLLPEPVWPWAAAAAPVINILILRGLCLAAGWRRDRTG